MVERNVCDSAGFPFAPSSPISPVKSRLTFLYLARNISRPGKNSFRFRVSMQLSAKDAWKAILDEAHRELPDHLIRMIRRPPRSEEHRVGKECRSRWSPYHSFKAAQMPPKEFRSSVLSTARAAR